MSFLCITPNPAIDRTLRVPGFRAGGVWRAAEVCSSAGGKGVNVARALTRLGRRAVCTGPLGGHTGRTLAADAERLGLASRWTPIDAETRVSTIIVGEDGATTVLNEAGPLVDAVIWDRLCRDVVEAAEESGSLVAAISGSLPPGSPADAMLRLIVAVGGNGRAVWVDTAGCALDRAIAAVPTGIKVNGDEAASVLGGHITTIEDAIAASMTLHARGPAAVAVTMGAAGAVLITARGGWWADAPAVAAVNPVGSGDCFLAGLLAALADGRGEAHALRFAVACGAANAALTNIADFEEGDLASLIAATTVRAVAGGTVAVR